MTAAPGRARGCRGKQPRAPEHQHRPAQHPRPPCPPRLSQLVEEHAAPHDPQQAVRVPQRKRDRETDVTDRKDRERVRHGPETSREDGPDDEVRRLADVRPDPRRAAEQGRQAPAGEEHAHHHPEGDDDRRDAEGDHLRGRFGGAEPGAGREAAGDPHELQRAQACAVNRRRDRYRIHRSTKRPPMSTATGTQNWRSRTKTLSLLTASAPRRSGRRRAAPAPLRATPAARCGTARSSWDAGSAGGTGSRAGGWRVTARRPTGRSVAAGRSGRGRERRTGATSCTGGAALRTAPRPARARRSCPSTSRRPDRRSAAPRRGRGR